MAKPFDATLKSLIEAGPADWVALAGFPGQRVDLVDADISTVSAASDKVFRVRSRPDWLLDLNVQSGPDASLPGRMHLYNALLEDRHGVLVRSAAILLTRTAQLTAIDGRYRRQFPGEEAYLDFRYQVIRVWELPVRPLLEGGASTLPLAPLAYVHEADVTSVVEQATECLRPQARGRDMMAGMFVLMGLRFERALVRRLLEGVTTMEESVTYQYIIEKGEQRGQLKEGRKMLQLLGEAELGPPSAEATTAIESITEPERLEELLLRVSKVKSWEQLLAIPAKPRTRRKR